MRHAQNGLLQRRCPRPLWSQLNQKFPLTTSTRSSSRSLTLSSSWSGTQRGVWVTKLASNSCAGCFVIATSSFTSAYLNALESEIRKIAKEKAKNVGVFKMVYDMQEMKSPEELEKRAREKSVRADIFITNAGVIPCPQHPLAMPLLQLRNSTSSTASFEMPILRAVDIDLHHVARNFLLPRSGLDPRQFSELQYSRT
jgi:hypothetical protein